MQIAYSLVVTTYTYYEPETIHLWWNERLVEDLVWGTQNGIS